MIVILYAQMTSLLERVHIYIYIYVCVCVCNRHDVMEYADDHTLEVGSNKRIA